jgi:hypothetical protein
MRTAAVLLLAAAALPAAGQGYFPLGDDDVWEYGYVVEPPFSDPDTVRFEPDRITERTVIRDTAYAVLDLPVVPTDTLRVGEAGRVWGRIDGRDALLFDVTRADGETYRVPDPHSESDYVVTVHRPESLTVPAGTFHDVIAFSFDVEGVSDDELGVTLARDVGMISAGSALNYGSLFAATVNGRLITATERGPLAADAEAFPNPFHRSLTVTLPAGAWHHAAVLDARGREVAALDASRCGSTGCTLRWNGAGHPPGTYVVHAESATRTVAVPVVLAR